MDPISQEEATEVRLILEKFYGPVAKHWDINYAIYGHLGKLIVKSGKCTTAMHLVPRPWDFSNPVKWSSKQVRLAVIRYFKTPESQHYLICMKSAALGMRADFESASLGL